MPSPIAPIRLNSLGSYWPREAVTVLLPGSVLTIELVAIVKPSILGSVSGAQLNGVSTAIAAIAIVASAVIIGYASRSIMFRIFQKIWKPAWSGTVDYRRTSMNHVRALFDDATVRRALKDSPVLANAKDLELSAGYWLYCKYWLRKNAPELAVDDFETDINLSYAFVPPVLLAVPALLHAMSAAHQALSAPVAAVLGVVALLIAGVLAERGKRKQVDETKAALERYVIAHLMRDDPGSATTG
jgi:hypothetical protein